MQPDPLVFLPAIRRELLRADLFGDALTAGLAPILMLRAGEGLVQLELRQVHAPRIVRALQTRQRALLHDGKRLLESARIRVPDSVPVALSLRLPPGDPGEEDIQFYERHVEAISACIASASLDSPISTTADAAALCADATAIEREVRAEYQAALAATRAIRDGESREMPPRGAPEVAALTSLLRVRFPQHPRVEASDLRQLPGINAQEIYFFELRDLPDWSGPMVLRRASHYNPTRAVLTNEFELLNQLHASGLPVARVLLAEHDPSVLGGPSVVMERLPGRPHTAAELAGAGRSVLLEIAGILARMHQLNAKALSAPYRDQGGGVKGAMQALIDRFYSRWVRERVDGSMILESAFAWLRGHASLLDDHVALVHGDCNLRNILIHEGRVSAVLDWELAHAGHAAEDLSYIRPDVEAVMPWKEFIGAYESAGGRLVTDSALMYFDVWRDVWRTSMAAAIYGAYIRGEHRNFIFGTVAFNEYYATLDTLGACMARVAPSSISGAAP